MRFHQATRKHSIKSYFQYVKNLSLTLNARRVNSNIFIHKRFQPALKGEVIIRRGSQRRSRMCVTSILINLSYVRFCFGFQVLIFFIAITFHVIMSFIPWKGHS